MRKHLSAAVGARQVELLWRSCGDRMEIPSGCVPEMSPRVCRGPGLTTAPDHNEARTVAD